MLLRLRLRRTNQRGQAMVEFCLIAITFFFVILGVIQLAMCINAYALVRYAAYNSARAAIVHNGNMEQMEEAARLSLVAMYPSHGRADHIRGFYENYAGAVAVSIDPDVERVVTYLSTKYFFRRITEVSFIDNNSLASGAVVTFDDPAAGNNNLVTVQVSHLYQLTIPLVNRILFYIYKLIKGPGAFDAPDIIGDPLVFFEGYKGKTLDYFAARTHRYRKAGGSLNDIEYRIPLVAHYTMRMQSDLVVP